MQIPPFSLSEQFSELANDLEASVLQVLRSGNYIGGNEVKSFEESFAEKIGVPYVVSCNSGTDALILALRALDIGSGDEVITTSFSFFATAEAISAVGAAPVFIDIDPDSYLFDLNQIESLITSKTKAILPVHLFGSPVNMEILINIASKYRLKIIEDCAQATGTKWNDQYVGSWGDIGCFSFFPTKNLGAAGDAGAITTKNMHLAKRIRELSVHGMPRRYMHTQLGYNSRMDSIQAAILNIKLPRLSEWLERRKQIAAIYDQLLSSVNGIILPSFKEEGNHFHSWTQYAIRVKDLPIKFISKDQEMDFLKTRENNQSIALQPRDLFKYCLEKEGVKTIIYYPLPIHLQSAYKDLGYNKLSLKHTEQICNQVLSLPIFPELSFQQQEYVVEKIQFVINTLQ